MQEKIRPGYKLTETGVIPEEWLCTTLGVSTVSIAAGRTTSFSQRGAYPVFGSTGEIGRTDAPTYSGETILVARVGANAGKVHRASGFYGVTDNTLILKPEKHLEIDYLYTLLIKRNLNSMVFGSGQPLITGGQLKALHIGLPPIPEQRAIAEALSDADARIAALEALITKKRDLKQAAMQQLLTGKTRLPGFSGDWKVKRLGDLGSTYGGLTGKSKADFGHGSAQYISFMNIMTNVVVDPNILEKVDVRPGENQNQARAGDLFFNGSSETPEEVGMCALLAENVEDLYLNSFCFGFRLKSDAAANGLFLAGYFRSQQGRDLLASLAQGATRYNLSKRALLRVEFACPPLDEQVAIAEILSDMDAELAALDAEAEKARTIKQGMMQNLLTGKVRLV